MPREGIVVGGGIVGCAPVHFCARDGMRVTLLERKTIGYGASGRNPGWLWLHCRSPGFARDISRAGRKLYAASILSVTIPPAAAARVCVRRIAAAGPRGSRR
jgi:glycine/D-amino acid oxidase-like deaminating enzyme